MNVFFRLLGLFFILLAFSDCKKLLEEPSLGNNYTIPEKLDDQLEVSSVDSVGLNKQYIIEVTNLIIKDYFKNINSLVIIRNNRLVYENYFNGYERGTLHNLYSASKSFTSCLVGIAIDKGHIRDTSELILPHYKELLPLKNASAAKDSINIKHLLTMTSGLECNDADSESAGNEERLYLQNDMLKSLFDVPSMAKPGTVSSYCSGGVIALAGIISKTTGSYTEFAKQNILEPLGITDYDWNYRKKNRKDLPDQIYMRSRDMAKFGMLYLNNGRWGNRQIVSESWVQSSLRPQVKLNGFDYGFLWWSEVGKFNNEEIRIYFANGNGGQNIFIIPRFNMVVVLTGSNLNSPYSAQGLTILNYIFPTTIN